MSFVFTDLRNEEEERRTKKKEGEEEEEERKKEEERRRRSKEEANPACTNPNFSSARTQVLETQVPCVLFLPHQIATTLNSRLRDSSFRASR